MQKQVSPNQNPLLESAHLIRLGVEMTNEMLNFHSPSLSALNAPHTQGLQVQPNKSLAGTLLPGYRIFLCFREFTLFSSAKGS